MRDKEGSPDGESTDMFNDVALRSFGLVRASFRSVMVQITVIPRLTKIIRSESHSLAET